MSPILENPGFRPADELTVQRLEELLCTFVDGRRVFITAGPDEDDDPVVVEMGGES